MTTFHFRKVSKGTKIQKGDMIFVQRHKTINKHRLPIETYIVVKTTSAYAYANADGIPNKVRGYLKFTKQITDPYKPIGTWCGPYHYIVFRMKKEK